MSSIAVSSSVLGTSGTAGRGRFARAGLATVAAAVIANVLVFFVGQTVVGYDPAFLELGSAFGIAVFTLIPAVVAVLLFAVLLRRAADPVRVFTIVSAIVFVVTLIPDFTYVPSTAGSSYGQIAILVLMHTVAAGVILGMLTTFARPNER